MTDILKPGRARTSTRQPTQPIGASRLSLILDIGIRCSVLAFAEHTGTGLLRLCLRQISAAGLAHDEGGGARPQPRPGWLGNAMENGAETNHRNVLARQVNQRYRQKRAVVPRQNPMVDSGLTDDGFGCTSWFANRIPHKICWWQQQHYIGPRRVHRVGTCRMA